VRAILGQQVSVRGASTLAARLAEHLGRPLAGFEHLGLSRLFPAPEVLAGADLSSLGLTGVRAATVRAFAQAVAGGKVLLDASQGLDRLVASLCEVPGVGPWTAHYIAMRAAGERDAFPSGDLGLRRGLGQARLSEAELLRRAEQWRPWRAYAAMHLWVAGSGP
jgi:3-methyladenine DNA glycosylase/8-oxoguanine DNA glycosylase